MKWQEKAENKQAIHLKQQKYGGWVGGWVDWGKSCLKDCLLHSTNVNPIKLH